MKRRLKIECGPVPDVHPARKWTQDRDNKLVALMARRAKPQEIAAALGVSWAAAKSRYERCINVGNESPIGHVSPDAWMVTGCEDGNWPNSRIADYIRAGIAMSEMRITASVPLRRLPEPAHVLTQSVAADPC